MGFTERIEYLTDFESIKTYLEEQDCFHDYSLGNIHINERERKIKLFIEDVTDYKKYPKEGTGKIWDIEVADYFNLKIDVDSAMPFWITEVTSLNDVKGLSVELDNGYIEF